LNFNPNVTYFKPRAIPLFSLEEVELELDELEVLKLCDYEDFDQKEADQKINIYQSNIQRILR
jgi:predicted DNA-binding protein (UPF0251 family)